MAKSFYGFQLGANIKQKEAGADVNIIPDNRTLMAFKLNDDPDFEAVPKRIKSMKEAFAHYQPKLEVDVKNLEGDADAFNFNFNRLKDFSKDGIIAQNPTLAKLEEQEKTYAKYVDIISNNDRLKSVLTDSESKGEMLELINLLITELSEEGEEEVDEQGESTTAAEENSENEENTEEPSDDENN